MAAPDQIREINEPVEHENPREEEVPATPHRKVLIGRQSRPGWKAVLFQFAVSASRGAEDTGRIEWVAEDRRHAPRRIAVVVLARRQREEGMLETGCRTPGQRGVGIEDLQPAHQKGDKADRIDPVADAHDHGMPKNDAASRRLARAHGGRKRRHQRLSIVQGTHTPVRAPTPFVRPRPSVSHRGVIFVWGFGNFLTKSRNLAGGAP